MYGRPVAHMTFEALSLTLTHCIDFANHVFGQTAAALTTAYSMPDEITKDPGPLKNCTAAHTSLHSRQGRLLRAGRVLLWLHSVNTYRTVSTGLFQKVSLYQVYCSGCSDCWPCLSYARGHPGRFELCHCCCCYTSTVDIQGHTSGAD